MNEEIPPANPAKLPKSLVLAKHPHIAKFAGLLLTGLAAVIPTVGTLWLLLVIYKILMRVGDELLQLGLRAIN